MQADVSVWLLGGLLSRCKMEYEGIRFARRSWKYARIFMRSLLQYLGKFGIKVISTGRVLLSEKDRRNLPQ